MEIFSIIPKQNFLIKESKNVAYARHLLPLQRKKICPDSDKLGTKISNMEIGKFFQFL